MIGFYEIIYSFFHKSGTTFKYEAERGKREKMENYSFPTRI